MTHDVQVSKEILIHDGCDELLENEVANRQIMILEGITRQSVTYKAQRLV